MADVVQHNTRYTIRVLNAADGPDGAVAHEVVSRVLSRGYQRYTPDGHLFATIVDADQFACSDDEEDLALGVYHSGVRTLAVAGRRSKDMPGDRWKAELAVTVGHEFMHYVQDFEGVLGDPTPESEADAEHRGRVLAASCGYDISLVEEA